MNKLTSDGVCAYWRRLTHRMLVVCGEPGRDMAIVYAFFLYLYEVCVVVAEDERMAIMRKTLK